jgi:hypothetical protein
VLDWFHPFFGTTLRFIMRILHLSDTSRVRVFKDIFVSGTVWFYVLSKNPHI